MVRKAGKIFQYYFVILLRFILPLFIFSYPLYIVIGATLLDAIDGEFAARRVLTKTRYQYIDKFMDNWWYLCVLIYSYSYFNQYFLLLLILFCYRIIGISLFYRMKKRLMLILFPNFFENAFFLIFFSTYFGWSFLLQGQMFYKSLLVVFLLKIIQEYWLHIAQKSIIEDVLKLYKHNWLPE